MAGCILQCFLTLASWAPIHCRGGQVLSGLGLPLISGILQVVVELLLTARSSTLATPEEAGKSHYPKVSADPLCPLTRLPLACHSHSGVLVRHRDLVSERPIMNPTLPSQLAVRQATQNLLPGGPSAPSEWSPFYDLDPILSRTARSCSQCCHLYKGCHGCKRPASSFPHPQVAKLGKAA